MSDRIVISGAGTGKTHKLVQTCIERLKDASAPIGIDEILIVTFTKAAAAELRQRIAKELNAAFTSEPASAHLARQIALLDRAQISTIHSFCLELVSRHFSELGLSPRLTTLEPAQAAILEAETLDELFEDCFAGRSPLSARASEAILGWFRGDDLTVRSIVRRLYGYTQSLADPAGWIARERAICDEREPKWWRKQFDELVEEWAAAWAPRVEAQPSEGNPARVKILAALAANDLQRIAALDESEHWPRGTVGKFKDPIKKLFAEATQLAAWLEDAALAEDWNWSRPTLATLLDLTSEFAKRFGEAKRERGYVDFNDLEQCSLKLLWEGGAISARAREWQRRFKLIFVDEYQDTNPAQDKILEAIALAAPAGNRFLVGDVKQSIYSFRHADPTLFQAYEKLWPEGREYLTNNWRSHERLLDFVNGLFGSIMSREAGGVVYDENARLAFAEHPNRAALSAKTNSAARVEVHYIPPAGDEDEAAGDESPTSNKLSEFIRAEAEAEILAARFREIVEGQTIILPTTGKAAGYGDIVVLIRAPRSEVEAFAKVFSRHGIPFDAKRSGYFDSIEVLDLINMLTILDNPLQDIPLLGALRSPIGCFTVEDLAALGGRQGATIFAALRALPAKNVPSALEEKAARFLERFDRWRKRAQCSSLAARLEEILEETSYEDWLLAQPRGAQRRANVRRFVELARQFDAMRGEGLFPFLKYLEDQMEGGELSPPSVEAKDAVRLVTVHNSKGLEYPIVALAGLAKNFNEQDSRGAYLIDREAGLALKVRPPKARRQYKSVPFWLAEQRQTKRMRDEEMRILYVALTRAKFNMILVARPGRTSDPGNWLANKPAPAEARSALDWIGPWLTNEEPRWIEEAAGEAKHFTWRRHTEIAAGPEARARAALEATQEIVGQLATVRERIEWIYPHQPATLQDAKSSATALRRQRAEEPELAGAFGFARAAKRAKGGLRANEAGAALHLFLEHAELAALGSLEGIEAERDRLLAANVLDAAQAAAINTGAVASFWGSQFGREILANKGAVQRELAFTAKFTAADLLRAGVPLKEALAPDEFIVVQGAADLVVLLPGELWLVDFKTDHLHAAQLSARLEEYAPQLMIYATALARIYGKPVTRACLHFLSLDRTEWLIAPPKVGRKPAKVAGEEGQLSFELPNERV